MGMQKRGVIRWIQTYSNLTVVCQVFLHYFAISLAYWCVHAPNHMHIEEGSKASIRTFKL